MKKVIIHAGPPKTGTTYVQEVLAKNREYLKSQNILYPSNTQGQNIHHFDFAIALFQNNESTINLYDYFVEDLKKYQTVIISSEFLVRLDSAGLQKLHALFEDIKFHFIFYLRTPTVRMLSDWQQSIKHGNTQSFEAFFLKHLQNPLESEELNFIPWIENVIAEFGRESIRLIDYESSKEDKTMIRNFFRSFAPTIQIVDSDKTVNQMIPLYLIELIRYYELKNPSFTKEQHGNRMYLEALKYIENDSFTFYEKMKKHMKQITLGNTLIDEKLTHLYNEKFADIITGQKITKKRKSYTIVDSNWTADHNAVKEANALYEKLHDLDYCVEETIALLKQKEIRSVAIFGTGQLAVSFFEKLRQYKIQIEAFIETSPNKTKMFEKPVYSLNQMQALQIKNIVIGSVASVEEIENSLAPYHVNTYHIYKIFQEEGKL